MSRSPQLLLQDILESCERIEAYVSGYDLGRFSADSKTQDAVIRQFEIIGEAVKKLPEALTEKATPNGYNPCLVSVSHSVNLAVSSKLPYDLTRDNQGVAFVSLSLYYNNL